VLEDTIEDRIERFSRAPVAGLEKSGPHAVESPFAPESVERLVRSVGEGEKSLSGKESNLFHFALAPREERVQEQSGGPEGFELGRRARFSDQP